MPKFRKKPVEVEAFQIADHVDFPDWFLGALANRTARQRGRTEKEPLRLDEPIQILTNHGWVNAVPGDWVIRQIDGEIYPCKKELFAATYDEPDTGTEDPPLPEDDPALTAAWNAWHSTLDNDPERDDAGLLAAFCAAYWMVPGGKLSPSTAKTLHNSDVDGARKNVPDIKVVGDGDMFALLCKASSQAEGWMKSTKAMQTPQGCVVQVTTQQRNLDGTYSVAEALAFVPGAVIVEDVNGGRRLGGMVEVNAPGATASARERFPETQSQYSDHV